MLKKNRTEIANLTLMARKVFNVTPVDDNPDFIRGFYECQGETVVMILNKIDSIIFGREEDEPVERIDDE